MSKEDSERGNIDWLKTASATFAGGAVAIGLVAIPTFVWLPSEFSEIKDGLAEALISADASVENSRAAAEAANRANASIEALTYNVALSTAVPIGLDLWKNAIDGDGLMWMRSVNPLAPTQVFMSESEFLNQFPADVQKALGPHVFERRYFHSKVGEQRWIFVTRMQFNELNADTQSVVKERLDELGFNFVILEAS